MASIGGGDALVVVREDSAKWLGLPYQEGRAGERDTWQRLFNLPADKERNPTVLSVGGVLYVGGGASTDGKVCLIYYHGLPPILPPWSDL